MGRLIVFLEKFRSLLAAIIFAECIVIMIILTKE